MREVDLSLALLRERYRSSLPSKREGMQAAWLAFRSHAGRSGTLDALLQLVHRLAGSAAAYGYDEIGEIAAVANRLLSAARAREPVSTPEESRQLIEELTGPIEQLLASLDAASRVSDNPANAPAQSAPLRVILIEDDADQAAAIAKTLENAGLIVSIAERSDALWELITLWPCDAIVVDYWLDRETALDIVRIVRKETSFAQIATICLTVETNPELLRELTASGCDAVLSKQEPPQRLIDAVREQVAKHRHRS
jgi:CheY-like chemotaxis protein